MFSLFRKGKATRDILMSKRFPDIFFINILFEISANFLKNSVEILVYEVPSCCNKNFINIM